MSLSEEQKKIIDDALVSGESILEEVVPDFDAPPSPEKVFAALDTVELRVGLVTEALAVPKSELIKMTVEFGPTIGVRTILGRIGKYVKPEELANNQFLFVTNLPPRNMKGIDSEGMILAAKSDEGFALMTASNKVAPGTRLG